jgi:hypothetical protein
MNLRLTRVLDPLGVGQGFSGDGRFARKRIELLPNGKPSKCAMGCPLGRGHPKRVLPSRSPRRIAPVSLPLF